MPRRFGARIAFFYAASFLVSGIVVPFLPVWLKERGFTPQELSACLAFPLAARLIAAPLAGWLADRAPNRRMAIIFLAALALSLFVPAMLAGSVPAVLVLTGLAVTAWQTIQPAIDALSLTGVRRFGLDYGRLRVWGSISFVATSLVGGALFGHFGAPIIGLLILGAHIACLLAAFALPVPPPLVAQAVSAPFRPRQGVRAVLLSPPFLVIAASTGLIQASHGLFYSFSTLQWEQLGFSGTQIGFLWATGVIAEIVMFAISKRFRRVKAEHLILAGALAALLRWSLIPLVATFLPSLFLQALHAFTFGASFVGMQLAIMRTVPEEMTAQAQGICMMTAGALTALTTLMSGPLYAAYGADAFWYMTIFAALAAAIVLAGPLIVSVSPKAPGQVE